MKRLLLLAAGLIGLALSFWRFVRSFDDIARLDPFEA